MRVMVVGVGYLSVCGLAACEPKIPRGVIACDIDDECPEELVCRALAGEVQKYCNSATIDVLADAAVRIHPGPRAPSAATFSTVLGPANAASGSFEEGFQTQQRVCSDSGAICVTGGFRP